MARQVGKPATDLADRENDALERGAMMGRPGAPLVRVQTQQITAIQVAVPRSLKAVKESVLFEATESGADFMYAWEVKDKRSSTGKSLIEGISIDGAMILLRNWTNATVDISVDDEGPSHWLLRATFIDYEKGFAVPRLFRQRKGESHGNFDAERALDIAFQIGQSKAERNAIDKGMPAWLKSAACLASKTAQEKKFADVGVATQQARKGAERLGVTDDELQRKVGKPFSQWLPRDLVLLSLVFRAIRDRITTVDQEFREAPAQPREASTSADDPSPAPVQPDAPADDAFATDAPPTKGRAPIAEQLERLAGEGPGRKIVEARQPGEAPPPAGVVELPVGTRRMREPGED